MARVYLYPANIIPKVTKRCDGDAWELNKGGCKDIQPLTKQLNKNNICKEDNNVISWGEVNPDAVDRNDPIYSSNFYNTITTYSGSYDTPTSFSTKGWTQYTGKKHTNLDSIPSSAKVKSISVQYAWDQVQYTKKNNHVTWKGSDNLGSYDSAGGYFKSGPDIHLRIGGKTRSVTGPNVYPPGSCTTRNANTYTTAQLRPCGADFTGVTGFNMGNVKNSFLTFVPSKNYASDVTRIVMRHIRLVVDYEDIPPAFNIKTMKLSSKKITNCAGKKTRLGISITNTSVTKGKTQVKIAGSGIANATLKGKKLTGSDSIKKVSNYYVWTINTACKNRAIYLDLAYSKPGKYVIGAKVTKNAGKSSYKKTSLTVTSCKPTFKFEFLDKDGKTNKVFNYKSSDNKTGFFRLTLTKTQASSHNEKLQINTDGIPLSNNWEITGDGKTVSDITITQKGNTYTFSGVNKYKKVIIKRKVSLTETGLYNVVGKYINTSKSAWNASKKYQIKITGILLPKDYFKLRLEDGSDVKYNSLMVTIGDDLEKPITYTLEEIDRYLSKMHIYGETKRIPVNEAQYVYFDIKLNVDEKIKLENVLTYIDIYDINNEADNIIIGATDNVKILSQEDEYICSIESISSNETTQIGLAVQSSVEIDDVVLKIKPYNYDGYNDEIGWIPAHVMFKDIPNIKISIEGPSDITYCEDNPNGQDILWLYYKIQNLSSVDAEDVRFQLKEPNQFEKICYQFGTDNDCEDTVLNANKDEWFNKNNRIITFKELKAHSTEKILGVKYRARKKGIYNFKIHTLDDVNSLKDDQYKNSYTHEVMVNVPSDVHITTDVSKKLPHLDELIDFHIKVKNLRKKQKTFKFDIYDIGAYDIYNANNTPHDVNDYCIEYVKCKYGTFEPTFNDSYQYPTSHTKNQIGTWTLNDIDINTEYHLTLSLRPKDTGYHVIKTLFTNELANTQCPAQENIIQTDFYNEVKVLEGNKQIDFNVYHAVSDDDANCDNCNNLIKICDDDFINLGDNIYYVFEIQNNSRNPIQNALHVYARLPESFLVNGVLCSSRNYLINQKNNLISFNIPNLPGCQHEDSKIQFCIKIKPSERGKFVSNFSLSTRSSQVLYKQLHLTVDSEFNERQLEHEIKIYNFSKTNRHYRYEIDSVGEIFKFYNTGDKTLRPIDIESYSKKAVEVYKGTNLKRVLEQIKNESKYVDPLFFRTGNNKIADKGYELFPDGLIRRFGLLNSEVYHYAGHFPKTTDLIDRVMIWDKDTWDTKLWVSDDYDNGVFELSIDYSKVPSNFDILDPNKSIKNLQNLVDNVKPYGTKAICHYSATINAHIQINADKVENKFSHATDIKIKLPEDFDVTSYYNRFDNTTRIHHDLAKIKLNTNIDKLTQHMKAPVSDKISSNINQVSSSIFGNKITKQTAQECYYLIANAYNANTQNKNIDITKPFNMNYDKNFNPSLSYIQIINFNNSIIKNKEPVGFIITPFKNTSIYTHNNIDDSKNTQNNTIYCVYEQDDINNFNGFKLILNGKIVEERNLNIIPKHISIQVQTCTTDDNKNVLHFWGSINNKEYYHIGLLLLSNFNDPIIDIYNIDKNNVQQYSVDKNNDKSITFKISDKQKVIHKNFDSIQAIERNNKWKYLHRINQNNNKYAYFENTINMDKVCDTKKLKTINVPKLVLKYNNINIDDLDEIVDINFKIEAQSNRKNFPKGVNINLYKNGDKYIPEDNIAREIIYPSTVTNSVEEFITTMDIEQNNMTICSDCLKTFLGYYDECPSCHSPYVRHYNEQTPATACHNCGWIIDGWNDYCTHCLSYDVEKIEIDYNKTYCQKCGTLSQKYYERCPQCLSSDVIHLTNNTNKYQIFGEDKQNIQPIIINIDPTTIDEKNKIIEIFSLYVPFNQNTQILQQLDYLTLKVHGTNNNSGKYYYCEACNSGGVGNYDKCPYCNSNLVHNTQENNNVLHIFNGSFQETRVISHGNFVESIDLKSYASHNQKDRFKLTFSIENQAYNKIIEKVLQLPIKDEYIDEIMSSLLIFDLSIDNLSLDYKYKDQQEWINLNKLEGPNHTGVSYVMSNDEENTNNIEFKDFGIKGRYNNVFLRLKGVTQYIDNDINMQICIINDNKMYYQTVNIKDMLFNYQYDITQDVGHDISDLSVQVSFMNGNSGGKITITECNIVVEYPKHKNDIHDNINTISADYMNQHDYYLFKPKDNNLWGLNDTPPYYLSGGQLDANLIAYIDFDKLDLQEYIRIYNIDMIIYYKTKTGYIATETISEVENDETYKAILKGAGYSDTNINNAVAEEKNLIDMLTAKDADISSVRQQQLISGDITRQKGVLYGGINYAENILNNLESKVTDKDNEGELISAIPLRNKIAQSFNTGKVVNSIDTIDINYFGKKGYPNDIINVYICEDYDNHPGNIIASSKVITNDISSVLNADMDIDSLQLNTTYWIVLEDTSANIDNYHRFKYNTNKVDTLSHLPINQLITYEGKNYTYQHTSLSFGINRIKKDKKYYNLPTTWSFNSEDFDGYKIHNTLYRYNIQNNNNISLSNFIIKNGYIITSVVSPTIEEYIPPEDDDTLQIYDDDYVDEDILEDFTGEDITSETIEEPTDDEEYDIDSNLLNDDDDSDDDDSDDEEDEDYYNDEEDEDMNDYYYDEDEWNGEDWEE